MGVHDVPAATDFYGGKLGLSFLEDEAKEPWRYFETRGIVFELFQAHPGRLRVNAWGDGQAFRPAMLVDNIPAIAATLEGQGISFSPLNSDFGEQLEMIGPEEICWSLLKSPDIKMDWAHPTIGGIELKATNVGAQKEFYTKILGMKVEYEIPEVVHLGQSHGVAWLRIQAGAVPMPLPAPAGEPKPALYYPIWISFETEDVKSAKDWLQEQNATILHPLTYHQDWDGTDIILADADGNAVQVVQYGRVDGI
jgi:catechol 2,3-dioxygenase-like lactoylglutathione lyase family enzyme